MSDAGTQIGRPTLYEESYPDEAHALCLLGATDKELAEHFGIGESTLYEWKNRYPEFADSIKKGKKPADSVVANALYERATGAEWVEQQAIKVKRVEYANGKRVLEEERVEVVEVTKRAPPDTTAGIFWLKNRRSNQWRDKHELTGEGGAALDVTLRLVRASKADGDG